MSPEYHLNDDGAFSIEDYQHKKAFSNFFPGVAGLWGVPMWAFYVNRGQAISSFGIESKDQAILEFQPANRAYRLTSIQGFRTFLKIVDHKKLKLYQPFSNGLTCSNLSVGVDPFKVHQRMIIKSHDLTIEEINATLGLKMTVNYFTLPQEPYAALVRRVRLENISRKTIELECVDGLPAMNPYGLKDWLSKHLSHTTEAWIAVHHIVKKAPFYQLKVQVADTPQVTPIREGNFYFAFDDKDLTLWDMVVEPALVFGHNTDFLLPEKFMATAQFKINAPQQTANRTPCAFSFKRMTLKPHTGVAWTAVVGFAHHLEELKKVVKKSLRRGYMDKKARENEAIIDEIKSYCLTRSSSQTLNEYCGQTFLDNILRGGLPISLPTAEGVITFHVYSRKHGDLERDYNFFTLAPTFLSQGSGNYRDVNQNRRHDVWFNTDVADSTIINFMNLIQADGYNPLIVKGMTFNIDDHRLIKKVFKEPAEFGEGFWSDHWSYNLDLIESFLNLYPEKVKEILIEKKVFSFYLSDVYVLPRQQRYILTDRGVRQYHSLAEASKEVKAKEKGYQLRVKEGAGDVYQTSLLVKMICILLNKVATLDPSGMGIEMEANKPNWYDALNGLPGLLGSSICETLELKRWALFIEQRLYDLSLPDSQKVEIFEELADFLEGVTHLLLTQKDDLKYWQESNDLKEYYRQRVRYGISGTLKEVSIGEIRKFLESLIGKVDAALLKARYKDGLFASYFYHEVIEYEPLDRQSPGGAEQPGLNEGPQGRGGHARPVAVRPLQFKRHDLPLFLEGFVHALRVCDEPQALKLFQAVKKSPLYDRQLGMYKVNASLAKESQEIGRTRIFPAGWLENESVWLHMEYKYLLELLRRGLVKEFYEAIKTTLIPFLDPSRYGRSILENSSFIVSSAHEDKNLHGQGFVARLSGSTAEFLHIWLLMNMGPQPFAVKDGKLTVTFAPLLAGWLFTKQNIYTFKFLNKTLVVYHNPSRRDTFGPQAVTASKIILSYHDRSRKVQIAGKVVGGSLAQEIRQGRLKQIDVILQ